MKVSTVIVTYNALRNNWLYKCLDSIQNSTLPGEIIIIDNHSKDETCNIIKENYPQVILIENQENLGFGKANNIGIEIALKNKADFVFLLNQDAWVDPDTIQKLLIRLNQNPDFGIISPLHLTGNGQFLDLSFSKSIAPQYCANLYSDFVLNKIANKVYEAQFICAAAWLISKNCLREVGGFNPTFFHYGEDDNYVHRLHFHNLKIGVLPTCKIYHDREGRTSNISFENKYYKERNRYLINLSNPNVNLTIDDVIRHLRILMLKSCFKFNLKQGSTTMKLLYFFKNNKKEIISNLNISKKNFFPFLYVDKS